MRSLTHLLFFLSLYVMISILRAPNVESDEKSKQNKSVLE